MAELLAAAFMIGFLLAICLVTGALAARKGYNFRIWFFAGGVIGLTWLCFLPFANSPELPDWEQWARIESGNRIGRNIALFSLVLVLVRLIAAT